MKKILLVLILLFATSFFSANAESVTLGLLLKAPKETQEWQRALKTSRPIIRIERYTFLIIPLGSDNTTFLHLTMTYIAFGRMYPDATPPPEFSKFFKVKTKDEPIGDFGRSILSSILLTLAHQQGYRIEHVTDNYVILAKPIYEKEQKSSESPTKKEPHDE